MAIPKAKSAFVILEQSHAFRDELYHKQRASTFMVAGIVARCEAGQRSQLEMRRRDRAGYHASGHRRVLPLRWLPDEMSSHEIGPFVVQIVVQARSAAWTTFRSHPQRLLNNGLLLQDQPAGAKKKGLRDTPQPLVP